ncbi:MAG: ankyrin repeat domain-containing protein [Gammaproteobacteria bacterium]
MPKKAKPASPSSAADDKKTLVLHKAAEDGDRAKVKRLLAKGTVGVNEPDANGRTPLFYAVEGGNEGVITDLLAVKAHVNATAKMEILPGLTLSGATLLHSSVLFDHPVAIDIFASKGAKINQRSDYGLTPLHLAAFLNRIAVARVLIKRGASVNLGDGDKATPLHLAARNNNDIVAGVLIANGSDLDIADENGDTPLHDAAVHKSMEVANLLIKAGAKINKNNKDKRTPLYLAQDHGHNEIADALIDASGNFGDMVAPKPEHKSIPEQVYDWAWGNIVAICGGTEIEGSGVIVKPGFVVTNRHVIEKIEESGEDIVVRTAENPLSIGKEHPYPVERVDGSDSGEEARDLCLLKVKGLKCPPIKIRKYQTLGIGEDVYAIGNPAGVDAGGNPTDLELSLSVGVISQLRKEGGHRKIQNSAPISPGSSGGGLFDRNGHLVGITTWVTPKNEGDNRIPQNLNFAIPADWLLGYFAK